MNKNIICSAVALLIITGCSSSYQQNELQTPEVKLDRNLGVLISTPEDGWYEQIDYPNSGRMTANAVRNAFAKNARKVTVTSDCKQQQCLEDIDTEMFGYYVQPIILHWEDRSTEWSGKSDKVEIQIITYDAKTKQEIGNSTYSGKSQWATFGGDHPQDLLAEPTNQYVESLYK
ncbi:DUF4823 domain-containing protein [Shewanella olleyana]|uniref:DUF4823 domain-containing protein n=1 Tax=Shewanella olleyana TaxID=135626 RepID=UPI00200C7303|nr:DUF4823 domain-containing protein [Shewanella olleyana]MCL1067426.1 DUF4823 domain-containing protein [Shewanella olleyana]